MRRTGRTSVLLALVAGSLLAGCTGGGGSDATSDATPISVIEFVEPTEAVTLDWWVLTIGDEVRPAITEAIEDFEKLHPKITIKIQERSIDAHKDAVPSDRG